MGHRTRARQVRPGGIRRDKGDAALVAVRLGVVSDVTEVLALWREAEAEPTHTDDPASLSALVAHDPGALLVAVDGGRIVGSVIAGWDGWRGSIYRLAVAPAHRGRGVGRLLLAEAERRLARAGATRIQAIVVETDERALGFWRSSGWVQQTERVRFVSG